MRTVRISFQFGSIWEHFGYKRVVRNARARFACEMRDGNERNN